MAEKKEEHQIPMELIKKALLEACLLDLEEILEGGYTGADLEQTV